MGLSDARAFKPRGKLKFRPQGLEAPQSGPAHPLAGSGGSSTAFDEPKGSSYIGTATDAETSLDRAMSQASSVLANAPEDQVTIAEKYNLEEIEESGWRRALGGVMSALEFVDRGRKTVSLAARDVMGLDTAGGGEQFSASAYGKVLTGRSHELVDDYGADVVGEGGHLTFSSMMDGFWSHDDDDAWWDKATRGLVSFGGDVLIDPLTYVTFGASGVGVQASRKAVKATIEKSGTKILDDLAKGVVDDAMTVMEKGLRSDIERVIPKALDDVVKHNADEGLELSDDVMDQWAREIAAGNRAPKGTLSPDGGDISFEKLDSYVAGVNSEFGVVAKKSDDVQRLVTNREFGSLKREQADYVEHVFTRRNDGMGPFSRLGQPVTVGGARLASPFGIQMQSRPLKLTQGAFQDWKALAPLRAIPQGPIGKATAKAMPFIDVSSPFTQVARRRFHDADTAGDLSKVTISQLDWAQQVRLKAGNAARNDVGKQQAFRNANKLKDALAELPKEEQDEVWGMLFPSMQLGHSHPLVTSGGRYSDEIVETFDETAKTFNVLLADAYTVIKKYAPNMGHIDNYVPLVFNRDFQRLAAAVREQGPMWSGEKLEEGARKLSKYLPDGEDISTEELTLFMEAYESMNSVAQGAAKVGEAAPIRRRVMGRYLRSLDEGVSGRIGMADFTEDGRAFADQTAMNESLNKVARAIHESGTYRSKWDDTSDVFVTDPIRLIEDYVAEVTAVAEQRAFLEASKIIGGSKSRLNGVNVDHLMHLLGDMTTEQRSRVNQFVANRKQLIEELMNAPENPTTVHLGMGATIDLPDEIVNDKRMVKALKGIKQQFGRLERRQGDFKRAREQKVKRLINSGLTPENADIVATTTDPALREARAEFDAAVEQAYLDLDRVLTETYFSIAEDGRLGYEMLEASKAQRDYVTAKAKGVWSSIEQQYVDQMRVDLPFSQQVSEQVLDPADQVAYTAMIDALTQPIRENMEQTREGIIGKLKLLIDDLDGRRQGAQSKLDAFADDKNALGAKFDKGHRRKTVEAELRALDEEADYLWEVIEMVASSNAIDDEIGVGVAAIAQKKAQNVQAKALASTWDTMVRDGIRRRREINPRIADEVEALWNDFFNEAHSGQGTLVGGQLDNPHFWTIVTDGVLDDWDELAEMVKLDPEFWADLPLGTHLSQDEIVTHLEQRVANARDTVEAFERLRAERLAREEMPLNQRVKVQPDYQDADLSRAKQLAEYGIDEPEQAARRALQQAEYDLVAVTEGDEAVLRNYIHAHMAGRFEGQITHAALKADSVTAGLQIGESLVSANRAFQIVSSAAYDPNLRDELPWALDFVNRQLAKLPGGARLREGKNGTIILAQVEGWKQKIIPFSDVVTAIDEGQVTQDILQQRGLGYLNGVLDVRQELLSARKAVTSQRGITVRAQQRAALAMNDFEQFMDIIDGIVTGKATGRKLRNFVQEYTATGTKDSAALARIKSLLTPEKQSMLDDTIQAVYMADARITPQGREMLAQQDQTKILETLFKPLEESLSKVERMSADLVAQQRAAATAEHRQYLENADEFLRTLSMIDDYRRATPPAGTAVEQAANRLGDEGAQTLETLLKDAGRYAKRLEHDGPFTVNTLIDDIKPRPTKGGKQLASDDDLVLEAVDRGQDILEALPEARVLETLPDAQGVRILSSNAEFSEYDHFVAYRIGDDGAPTVLGTIWEDDLAWNVAVIPSEQGKGIGSKLGKATGRTQDELLKGDASLSEAGAALANKNLRRVVKKKYKSKELGFTKAAVRKLYGGDGFVARSKAASEATLSAEGMVNPAAFGLSGVVGDYDMDPMIAVIFRNMIDGQKYLYTPEGMGQLRTTLHTLQRQWRGLATVTKPNFHLRNMISGVTNGFLVGVGPKDYTRVVPQYMAWRRALAAGATREAALEAVDPKFRHVIQAALDQNILADGFVASDLAIKGTGRVTAKPYSLKDPTNKFVLTQAGGKVMESMEDVLRLSVFQKYLDPSYVDESMDFAREMVMMVHFDYQNLTHLERRFKAIAPFFIWTRRNVPLQLRTLMQHPGALQVQHHFSNAMNDNFGTEEYRNSPLPSYYGALAAPLGLNVREGEENWMRFVLDPELPITNLENLPFLDRDETGLLPINMARTLSPGAWMNYMAELMGPGISLPLSMIQSEEEGGYQTNAPTGLNEIGLLLENVDFFNVLNAEGEDWRWSNTQAELFSAALPFFKDFTGGIENTPTTAAGYGTSNKTGLLDPQRILAEMMGLTGKGLGVKAQVPHQARGASYEASETTKGISSDVKQRMGNNPLAFGEDPENDLLSWAKSLTSGG